MILRKVWGSVWSGSNSCKDSVSRRPIQVPPLSSSSMGAFDQLPTDILVQILMLMEPRDTVKLSLTCKAWKCLADDNRLWIFYLQCSQDSWDSIFFAETSLRSGYPLRMLSSQSGELSFMRIYGQRAHVPGSLIVDGGSGYCKFGWSKYDSPSGRSATFLEFGNIESPIYARLQQFFATIFTRMQVKPSMQPIVVSLPLCHFDERFYKREPEMSTVDVGGRGKKRKNKAEGGDGSLAVSSPLRRSLRSTTSTPAKPPLVVEGEDAAVWSIFEIERKRKQMQEEAKKKTDTRGIKFPLRFISLADIPETGKVTTYCKIDHILAIKKILGGSQFYTALLNGPLGTVFEIPVKKAAMSGRLVHNMLCRMLFTKKKHEIWFVVANKPIRFSLKEFAVLTGLPCGPYPPEAEIETLRELSNSTEAYWHELMVGRLSSGYISDIVDLLKDSRERARIPFSTIVRLCLVVLVDGVLCPRGPASVKATRLTVEMVKDVRYFLAFPWGRQSFELTLDVCRVGSESNETVEALLKKLVGQTHICLKGFPAALQMLFYEAVPAFNSVLFPDPREVPVDFARTTLDKIELNRSFTNKDIIKVDEDQESVVIHMVDQGYEIDGVDLSWKDEVADPLVDNIMRKLEDGFVFKRDHWKKGAFESTAAAAVVPLAKKERARGRKPSRPTRRSTRGRTKQTEAKEAEVDVDLRKYFVHNAGDLINDFFHTTVTPLWQEKVKREAKIKAQADERMAQSEKEFYADLMNALINNTKAQNIFKGTEELADSSAGSKEGEASSDSVGDDGPPKDGKGKGKVAEADVTILSDDELLMEQLGTKPYAVRQPGTGPSGMRQPLFDETPQKSKKAKTTGGLDLDELMELDAEKEDEEMAELAGLDKLVNKVVSETGGNDGRRDEDTSMVGALGIVCGLQAADTPKAPAEAQETPLPLAERQPDVVHEDPVVPEEEAKAVDAEQVGGVSEATDFNLKELGFAAVEEWKTNIFYKKIDAFVPMQYIVNDLAVPKTIFREIATKGEHVSTNHMELMLALVWNKLRTSLSEKRAVVLDTNFMQHLLKDEDKLKQKRSKPFKWHRSLVAIVNGEYAPRAGNTGWIVDVDVVYAPMNWSGNHWVALCIDLVGGIVTVFDCFHGLHSEEKAVEIMAPVLESLPQLIADNADPLEGDYEAPTSFVFKRPKNVSQNIPTGDCGPMSVKFIELHAQGKPLDCMTEEMVDNLRVNYAVDIYETFYTPLS